MANKPLKIAGQKLCQRTKTFINSRLPWLAKQLDKYLPLKGGVFEFTDIVANRPVYIFQYPMSGRDVMAFTRYDLHRVDVED